MIIKSICVENDEGKYSILRVGLNNVKGASLLIKADILSSNIYWKKRFEESIIEEDYSVGILGVRLTLKRWRIQSICDTELVILVFDWVNQDGQF